MPWNLAKAVALTAAVLLGGGLAEAQEFAVGAHIPLSGPLARVGGSLHDGIRVAADLFNRTHPKYRINLIVIDDESSPAKAVAAVERLVSQGVVAITGGYGSNIVGPASDAARKAGLVYVTSGAVSGDLTERGHKGFFRINNNAGYTKAMVGTLLYMGVKSVSAIYSTRDAPSELARDVERALTANGVKVTMHAFDPAMTDFKPIVNKVKLRDRSEAIAMIGYENDYVGIIRAAKVLKPNVKAMVGVWSLAVVKMAADFPDLMPNVYGTAMLSYPAKFSNPEGKRYAETYQRLHGKDPDYLGQFGYIQAQLLFEAIVRAHENGTLARGGLADEMRRTDRDTRVGRVTFDDKGDNPHFLQRMGQHQNGRIVIVWPPEAATEKMNFPGVPW